MIDWIELTDFRLHPIVGILPSERVTAQPLDVEVSLGLDLSRCGETGDLRYSVNYAAVAEQVTFLITEGRWHLLESLAVTAARLLLAPPSIAEKRAQIHRVRLSLRKPTILGDIATPGIIVERDASWCDLRTAPLVPGVTADILVETEHTQAYRVHLAPGATWKPTRTLRLHTLAGAMSGDGAISNDSDAPASVLAVWTSGD